MLVFLPGYKKQERREGPERKGKQQCEMRYTLDGEIQKPSLARKRSDVHEFFMY